MALKLLDVGAEQILKKYLKHVMPTSEILTLRLFVNNVTPADTGISYTEAVGGGYAAIPLTPASDWTVSTVSGIPQGAYPRKEFVFTGDLTTNVSVYGYYLTDADGVVIYAERNLAIVTPHVNDVIGTTPIFKLSYGTPA